MAVRCDRTNRFIRRLIALEMAEKILSTSRPQHEKVELAF